MRILHWLYLLALWQLLVSAEASKTPEAPTLPQQDLHALVALHTDVLHAQAAQLKAQATQLKQQSATIDALLRHQSRTRRPVPPSLARTAATAAATSTTSCSGDGIGHSITSFGASTDNPDNAPALRAAIAAHPCDTILVPAGVFNFTSSVSVTMPPGPCAFSLVGAGQGPGGSTLNFNNGSDAGLRFKWQSFFNSIHVRHLLIATTAAGGDAVGLTVVNERDFPSPGYAPATQNSISHVTFQGSEPQNPGMFWGAAVHISNINYNLLRAVFVYGGGSNGTGLLLGEPGGAIVGDTKIVESSFINLDVCVAIYNNPQGVILSSSTLIDSNVGIQTNSSNPYLEGLQVMNCNMACRHYNIYAKGMINDLILSGNLIITNALADGAVPNGFSLFLQSLGGFTITGNDFFISPVRPSANTTAIYVGDSNGYPGIAASNVFRGPFFAGLVLGKSTADIVGYPNAYGTAGVSGPATAYVDSGVRNKMGPG